MVIQATPTPVLTSRPIERKEVTRPVETSRNVTSTSDTTHDFNDASQVVVEADESYSSNRNSSSLIEDIQRQLLDSNKSSIAPVEDAPDSIQANKQIAKRAFEAVSEKAKEQSLSQSV